MMIRLRIAALTSMIGVTSAHGIKLMDQIGIASEGKYDYVNGNHEDGSGRYGDYYDLRCADDFRNDYPFAVPLTSVKVANVGEVGGSVFARVRIYQDAGALPGAELYAGTFGITSQGFSDTVFGLIGNIHTADVSGANWILAPGRYWVNMQTVSAGDWEWTCRSSEVTGYDSALGDGPNGRGAYGFALWQSAGATGFGRGDSAYEVNGGFVPEPSTLIALGVTSSVLLRRRKALGPNV